jgi:hypothetical protein
MSAGEPPDCGNQQPCHHKVPVDAGQFTPLTREPVRFVLSVFDEDVVNQISKAGAQPFVSEAPAGARLPVFVNPERSKAVGMAAWHLHLKGFKPPRRSGPRRSVTGRWQNEYCF